MGHYRAARRVGTGRQQAASFRPSGLRVMFCVIRISSDEVWMWVWWFADSTVRGRLVLERFSEYRVALRDPHGMSQYFSVRDCSMADGTLDASTVPFPDEVMVEASVRVRREALP